ncbi:hypothetical protein CROQUDRAFT_131585 [Cronartium quercuum f. sp. fusiforme G11]|uniref:Integrase zinc-binding domain-containing protein n=1 Tax=Cronartium quercuum f. sp. fusiforme G11 TaxID=708437 RepID=A0A9P6NT60_9BASI|nr:hypothetical protein CROQUDRAFT_131585 [Cronartium quercuum f. sp. fusiforme G11]
MQLNECESGRKIAERKKNLVQTGPMSKGPTGVREFFGFVFMSGGRMQNLYGKKECDEAFNSLKEIIGKVMVLRTIICGPRAGINALGIFLLKISVGVTILRIQDWILNELHEKLGHKGIEETYRRMIIRFLWPSIKKEVKAWVASFEACQNTKIKLLTLKELGHTTGQVTLFGCICMDTVYIKANKNGYKYLIVARGALSG